MDYKWHYDKLIETRKLRPREKEAYYELHHIKMKSMGGTNDNENLVYLTGREHFLAHWLLWRIHRNHSTASAFHMMRGAIYKRSGLKISSRSYEEARESFSNSQKGANNTRHRNPTSEETRKKISDASKLRKGKKMSEQAKLNLSKALTGKKHPHVYTEEGKKKLNQSRKGVKIGPHDDDWNKKISEAQKGEKNHMFGKHCSEESKHKKRIKMQEIWKNKKQEMYGK